MQIDQKYIDKLIENLKKQQKNSDTEEAHGIADDMLCDFINDLGYHEVVKAWEEISKWYA